MSPSGGNEAQTGVPRSPSARSASRFPRPWQPLTPRGAAAFARASLNVVCCFQAGVALLSACSVIWFLHQAVLPVIRQGISQLPEEGSLRMGELQLPGGGPVIAENGWMALRVDLDAPVDQALLRDLEIRFGPNAVRVCTGVGSLTLIYPPDWLAPFNRLELTTWWEAWQPIILAIVGFATVCSLLFVWWILAALYAPLPRMLAFFGDRDLPLDGAWRMSAASLLAGSVFLSAGFFAFGFGWIGLPQFLLFFGIHWVLPIVYLVIGTTVLPPRPMKIAGSNPFIPLSLPESAPAVAAPSGALALEPPSALAPAPPSVLVAASPDAPAAEPVASRRKRVANPFAKPAAQRSVVAANPFTGSSSSDSR
ncbi:MAG: hypothetical protein HYR88_09415 [Verrucomicrobia bacterium]|nr:hypothetical protein [Verrucomicrobiota bacterium]MBI3870980.1 hypothetical protein [Verrucomicrobiota bacterium]